MSIHGDARGDAHGKILSAGSVAAGRDDEVEMTGRVSVFTQPAVRPLALAVLAAALLFQAACSPPDLPPEVRIHMTDGEEAYKQGKFEEAARHFEAALRGAPASEDARLRLGATRAAMGRYDDAALLFREVLDENPNSAAAYEEWGVALARQKRVDEAVRKWQTGAELDPTRASNLARLGVSLLNLRRFTEAAEVFERLSKAEPSVEVLVNWGTALHNSDRPDEAREKYEAALEISPDHLLALNNLGVMLSRGEAERARGIELLEKSLRGKPADPMTLHNLGWAYLQEKRYEEAFNLIQRSLGATDPRQPLYAARKKDLEEAAANLPREAPTATMPNVLLILLDTVRYDHLGAYGYPRKTTPNIDALAKGGVVLEQAISQAPWTAASVASLFTSLYPSVHGIDGGVQWGPGQASAGGTLPFAIQKTLSAKQMTLAEMLRRRGYQTAGFVSNVYLNSMFGFSQGFSVYHDEHGDYSGNIAGVKRRAEQTNRYVFDWLRSNVQEPFFLFVHYNDAHWPYDPPNGLGKEWVEGYAGALTPQKTTSVVQAQGKPITNLSPADVQYLIGLYDGELLYLDRQVGALLEQVRSAGFKRPLVTIVTSDHGEEFLDHGSASHGYTLYDEQVRVPLIVHFEEGLRPRRVSKQVRTIDLLPTILDLAGIDAPEGLQGKSFLPLLEGKDGGESREAYSEATYNRVMHAVRTDAGPKLIRDLTQSRSELYDVRRDPVERDDLAAREPARVGELSSKLDAFQGANETIRLAREKEGAGSTEVILDSKTQDQLRALGYIH